MNRKTFVTAQVELFRRIATVAQTVRGEAPETRTCRSEEPGSAQIFGVVSWDQAPAALFSAADGRNFRALEGFDPDRLARLRIAAFARRALGDGEGTEVADGVAAFLLRLRSCPRTWCRSCWSLW